jgi:hypothetical protein
MPLAEMNRWLLIRGWSRHLGAVAVAATFVAIAAYTAYLKSDRSQSVKEYTGTLEALHQSQDITGSRLSVFYVRLPNTEVVTVTPPELTPFRKGARVRIVESTKESGRTTYSFGGYVDAASNNTVERDARKSGARPSP